MGRIHFIVEGDSEEEFVKSLIFPYLFSNNIHNCSVSKIHTSKNASGGFTNYDYLKNDLTKLLRNPDIHTITTFIDFFRLPTSFPNYGQCSQITDHQQRVQCFEKALSDSFNNAKLIPYIQLHEFEALLFSSLSGFRNYFNDSKILDKVGEIIEMHHNPEEINDNPTTTPSNRLKNIIPGYNKVLYGNLIAMTTGIEIIMDKCPRFNHWLNQLIKTAIE